MWLSGSEEFTCPRVGLNRDPGSKFPRCAVIGHPVITRQGRLPPPPPLDPHSAEEKDSGDLDRRHSPVPRFPGWAGECVSCHAVFKPGYSATHSPLISDYYPLGHPSFFPFIYLFRFTHFCQSSANHCTRMTTCSPEDHDMGAFHIFLVTSESQGCPSP